jgi:hypothetical protein
MTDHDDGHEHEHDEHGQVMAGATDVIPETSLQDKLLVLLCGLALAALIYYGYQWAFALTTPESAGSHSAAEESH